MTERAIPFCSNSSAADMVWGLDVGGGEPAIQSRCLDDAAGPGPDFAIGNARCSESLVLKRDLQPVSGGQT